MDRRPGHPTLDDLRELLARWDLGLLAPESVPALAGSALLRACTIPEILDAARGLLASGGVRLGPAA